MGLKASTRATATTAVVAMTAGLPAILYGVVHDSPARSLGGVALIMTAFFLTALTAIKRWITDTREEQRQLAQSVREAQDERNQYVAAKAALANEHQRLLRDAQADRARSAATLAAERAAVRREFEEERAQLVCDTFEAAVQMARNGMLDKKPAPRCDKVIQFPAQAQTQERSAERERSREHGVVGP